MTDLSNQIDAALKSEEKIDRDVVVRWIEQASDLRTLSKLYRLTDGGYYRIQPELGSDTTCELIQRYLLECIRQNVEHDDEIESRFDAAMTLHAWFRHLVGMGDADAILRRTSEAITELYLSSEEDIRYTIETGFLEHALETAAIRPYFEHWANDPRLAPAWKDALAWGEAHPDYMAKLMQSLKKYT